MKAQLTIRTLMQLLALLSQAERLLAERTLSARSLDTARRLRLMRRRLERAEITMNVGHDSI